MGKSTFRQLLEQLPPRAAHAALCVWDQRCPAASSLPPTVSDVAIQGGKCCPRQPHALCHGHLSYRGQRQWLTLPWPWLWSEELHLVVLHQLFAVVKALEDLDMDLVLTQLAPSGWLLGFPDKKLPFITCGQLHSSPGRYLSREIPLLPSRAQCPLVSSFSIVAP